QQYFSITQDGVYLLPFSAVPVIDIFLVDILSHGVPCSVITKVIAPCVSVTVICSVEIFIGFGSAERCTRPYAMIKTKDGVKPGFPIVVHPGPFTAEHIV